MGRKYLGMTGPRVTVATADARWWLRTADRDYSAIVVDAYRQPYIPFHLVSKEFFATVGEHLRPDGVVAINVGTPPGQLEAVEMIGATMSAVFPSVHHVRYDEFNSVLIGYRQPTTVAASQQALSGVPTTLRTTAQRLARGLADAERDHPVLTDDHAPIEWVTDRALIAYLREGAPGAERP